MGYQKHLEMMASESGLVAGAGDGLFVCADCFTDASLQAVVQDAAESDVCSFCDAESDTEIAAPLGTVMEHIGQCLLQHYEDAANSMGFESAEGGYLGETFDSWDLLDHIGMESYLADDRESLLDAIRESMDDRTWCERDPYALRQHEALSFSWQQFCELIKYERRFFFLQEKPAYTEGEGQILDPGAILRAIVTQSLKLGLITPLDQGTFVYRVRQQPGKDVFCLALDLGPPPSDKAVQANRMSPPGIVMTYVSEDEETALLETVDENGCYSIGRFELARSATVLDLTRIPEVPSFFDLAGAPHRDAIIFLREFANDVSKPIDRDAKVGRFHVEYVPTQVVTEYLRVSPALRKLNVEGLRFTSSRTQSGVSLVLFGGRDLLELSAVQKQQLDDRERRFAENRSPLLRLVRTSSRAFPRQPTRESSSDSPKPSSGRKRR